MTDIFRCGDQEALVAYLYNEGDPAEGDAVAAHVAGCPSCAEEIAGLQSTRRLLATWAPPDAALGFQITGPQADATSNVVDIASRGATRGSAWWRQPLPAWAQAAAAVLIFAVGLLLGGVRTPSEPAPLAATARPAATATAPAGTPGISRADLARVEERLRAIEAAGARGAAQAVTVTPVRTAAPADDRALLQRVEALIAASEERQRRENITMMANLAREFETQRRVDLRQVEDRLGRIQGTTGLELQQQRDMLNYFVRTSLTGAAR